MVHKKYSMNIKWNIILVLQWRKLRTMESSCVCSCQYLRGSVMKGRIGRSMECSPGRWMNREAFIDTKNWLSVKMWNLFLHRPNYQVGYKFQKRNNSPISFLWLRLTTCFPSCFPFLHSPQLDHRSHSPLLLGVAVWLSSDLWCVAISQINHTEPWPTETSHMKLHFLSLSPPAGWMLHQGQSQKVNAKIVEGTPLDWVSNDTCNTADPLSLLGFWEQEINFWESKHWDFRFLSVTAAHTP